MGGPPGVKREEKRYDAGWIMLRLNPALTAAAFVFLIAIGCRPLQAQSPAVTLRRVPEGGLQPQVAATADGTTHLVYFLGEPRHGDLFYVRSADGGTTFSRPVRVNSTPGSAIATGTIRGAQIAVGTGGRVHLAWNSSDGTGCSTRARTRQARVSSHNGTSSDVQGASMAAAHWQPMRPATSTWLGTHRGRMWNPGRPAAASGWRDPMTRGRPSPPRSPPGTSRPEPVDARPRRAHRLAGTYRGRYGREPVLTVPRAASRLREQSPRSGDHSVAGCPARLRASSSLDSIAWGDS